MGKGKKQNFNRKPTKYDYDLIREIFLNNPALLNNHEDFGRVYTALSGVEMIGRAFRGIIRDHPEIVDGKYVPSPRKDKPVKLRPEVVEDLVSRHRSLYLANASELWRAYMRETGEVISHSTILVYHRKNRERWRREQRNGKAQPET